MKSITFSSQKGGICKTTSCRELGITLWQTGNRVLFIDMDPQGNLSKSLTNVTEGLYDAMTDGRNHIQPLRDNLDLLAGDIRLSLLEKNLLGEVDAHIRLQGLFEDDLFSQYDYVLIDTPPALGVLTLNALTAADFLIIPVSCRMYSLQGTNDLMSTISKVKKTLNPDLKLLGVLINMFDKVPVITREIRSEIESNFGELVFKQAISKSIRVEEAIAEQKGIVELPIRDRIKDEIISAAQELIQRCSL